MPAVERITPSAGAFAWLTKGVYIGCRSVSIGSCMVFGVASSLEQGIAQAMVRASKFEPSCVVVLLILCVWVRWCAHTQNHDARRFESTTRAETETKLT